MKDIEGKYNFMLNETIVPLKRGMAIKSVVPKFNLYPIKVFGK